MKVTVTTEQVLNFKHNAERYINARPGVFNKFIYALSKGLKNVKQAFEDYSEKIQDEKYNLAEKDEKKNIIIDHKNQFVFNAESRKKLDKKDKELLQQTVEVSQYDCTDIPDDVTVLLLDVFCPFVVTEEDIENKFHQHELNNHKQELKPTE